MKGHLRLMLVGCALVLAACNNNNGGSTTFTRQVSPAILASTGTAAVATDPTQGNLQILAVENDQINRLKNITLGFSQIQLHDAVADQMVTLGSTATQIGFYYIQDGNIASLTQGSVAASTYDSIQLSVSYISYAVGTTGEMVSISFQPGTEEQVTIGISPTVTTTDDGSVTHLLLDFGKGLPHAFSHHNFLLSVFATDYDQTGLISGSVSTTGGTLGATTLTGAKVIAYGSTGFYAQTKSDSSGNFNLIGLPADNYNLFFYDKGYQPTGTMGVTVTAGSTAVVSQTMNP
jgi:hypothetical protein